MGSERERIKRALLAEIGGMVDEVLEWEEKHSAPTLVEIEEVVLQVRQRVGQRLAEFLVERQAAARPVPGPACPQCGQEMRYKGNSSRTVVSRIGPLEMRRGYYCCERRHGGFFPLDRQLGLRDQHWSEGMVKEVVRLSALMPYEQVAETLKRIGQIPISGATARRLAQARGERFQRWEEAERRAAHTLSSGEGIPERRGQQRRKRIGVAMDGGMLHIRGEGWKEVKVGIVFEVAQRQVLDKETGERVEAGRAVQQSYVAHLGGPEEFGEKLWAEARRRGWEGGLETEVLGDGAAWIWNLAADYFYDSCQIVDWYHAREHLACAAGLLKGEGTEGARRWLQQRETTLYQGHAIRIAQELEGEAKRRAQQAEELRREAGYFRHNARRMNYLEMREEGWVIGSGAVESGVKQFKARFAGPGMRWSRIGAERLLPVRAAVMSHRFDQIWSELYALP